MDKAITLTNHIIEEAIKHLATDIHFIPDEENVKLYYRINGYRHNFSSLSLSQYQTLLSYLKFTGKMDIGQTRKPQSGTIPFKLKNSNYSLRISTLPSLSMESLAIRILEESIHYSLQRLFLFPNQTNAVMRLLEHSSGIILFTGPTGSGKSTTMYGIVAAVVERTNCQTITLEDPVEKKLDNVLQVQINESSGFTYDTGLKAALRHDPDIILVGEIRDKETAQFAFRAANTGHLVISTLHARNTIGTIHRLKEMNISNTDLEQNLIAIASTNLLPLTIPKYHNERAAIIELLSGNDLLSIIQFGDNDQNKIPNPSFLKLRRRAYAYGFINDPVRPTPPSD
ncbi:competence protein ComGA [Gracilibacillus halotolerans]|uniref:Competence protein ComGA n=1 Tax=Gracilibacillus halotolerans TaxID=74386 RepID=A0A841RJF3_9BACI|nr:competence type IV pilus ATPase ComGA [Gracilibacillus halotolerans]MBB6511773.1 competence protein ComGA [Gracilibacillus halotolerans]